MNSRMHKAVKESRHWRGREGVETCRSRQGLEMQEMHKRGWSRSKQRMTRRPRNQVAGDVRVE